MTHFYFSRQLDILDFSKVEVVGHILKGLSDIVEYDLFPRLKEWTNNGNVEVSVSLLSHGYVQSVKEKYDGYYTKRSYPFDLQKVSEGQLIHTTQDGISRYSLLKLMDFKQFKDLAKSEVLCNGKPFPFTSYDIHKLNAQRVRQVRNILLDVYYESLKYIGKSIGLNQNVLDSAYQTVRARPWHIEKNIGEVVFSRGKNPRKVQLIARWEPDYIYHIARIYEDDGSSRDINFMIYWRNVSSKLIESPGRLSWMNKDTLKYIPNSSSDYRLSFKVDNTPIDFSYYFNPKGKRSFQFRSHLMDNNYTGNLLRLNY